MSQGDAVFLDTSVQIARFVHGEDIKKRIEARTSQYALTVTSEVVKQEFKRRLLKEAQYLLNQLNSLGSFEKVLRHIIDNLPLQLQRKKNICLDTLQTIFEGGNDADLTERAKSYLRTLLRFGLDDFEDGVQHVERSAECMCARFPVIERKPYRVYDLGKENCSKVAHCNIAAFLIERMDLVKRILGHLQSLDASRKTEELQRTQQFLESLVVSPQDAPRGDPCLKVGDLIIALESANVPDFYTFNSKESQHFCRILDQTMIVRPKYHIHDDIVCSREEQDWAANLADRRSHRAENEGG